MTAGGYVLSCRLTSGPLWLGIYLFLWWFLLVLFGLFLLHWRYELPCQDKLPEFHYTPNFGCIRVLWLVFHPLGLGLDKALFGWNSVTSVSTWCSTQRAYCSIRLPLLMPNPAIGGIFMGTLRRNFCLTCQNLLATPWTSHASLTWTTPEMWSPGGPTWASLSSFKMHQSYGTPRSRTRFNPPLSEANS